MSNQEHEIAAKLDDIDQIILHNLHEELEHELEKPDAELDVNKINQIAVAIEKITGSEYITEEKTQQGIQKLEQKLHQQRWKRLIHKTGCVAACIGIVLLLSNIWSFSVYGINSFSAAYKLMHGGITINCQNDDSEPYSGNPYLEDMQSRCKEHELDVLLPNYIPENMQPTDMYGSYGDDGPSVTMDFHFKKKSAVFNLSITRFKSEDETIAFSIPSSEYQVSEQQFGDTTVHISKEKKDHQYWALFRIDLTQYVLYTAELDYDECQRILESMFS